jgi:hypothetical protein
MSPRDVGASKLLSKEHTGSHRTTINALWEVDHAMLGSIAFGPMTAVNLIVLAAVLYGMFHRGK